MKTTKQKIEVMQAYEDGKEIEYLYTCTVGNTWSKFHRGANEPNWDWALYDYRIKEEPKRRALTQQEFLELGIQYIKGEGKGYYSIKLVMETYIKIDDLGDSRLGYGNMCDNQDTGINYKGETVNLWKEVE